MRQVKMKNLRFGLIFLAVIAVGVQCEEKDNQVNAKESGNRQSRKTSEKRWLDAGQNPKSQQFESKNYDIQTDKNGQEAAKEEKTLRDFIEPGIVQNVLIKALKPKPIVDTASPEEKNSESLGSGPEFLGHLIVRGSEAVSRAINTIFDIPKQAFTKLSGGASQALNQLGAYLVGL